MGGETPVKPAGEPQNLPPFQSSIVPWHRRPCLVSGITIILELYDLEGVATASNSSAPHIENEAADVSRLFFELISLFKKKKKKIV